MLGGVGHVELIEGIFGLTNSPLHSGHPLAAQPAIIKPSWGYGYPGN